jgi:hypothetical protein
MGAYREIWAKITMHSKKCKMFLQGQIVTHPFSKKLANILANPRYVQQHILHKEQYLLEAPKEQYIVHYKMSSDYFSNLRSANSLLQYRLYLISLGIKTIAYPYNVHKQENIPSTEPQAYQGLAVQ